jgi:hypothetical protein
MPLVGTGQLAALAFAGVQAATPAAPCACEQFERDARGAISDGAVLSADARTLRDFVLFSHRRIGADLIRKHGPYLDTLSAFFPHCPDEAVKLAWLRQLLAGASDTQLFAERIAQQYETVRACTLPAR